MTTNKFKKRNYRQRLSKTSKTLLGFSCITFAMSAYAVIGANIGSISSVAWINSNSQVALANSESASTSATISGTIEAFSLTTRTNIKYNMENLLSAIKVATAQNAQSSQSLAEIQTSASQKLATARQTIDLQDKILKTIRDYGSATGQGFKACAIVASNNGLQDAVNHANNLAASKETETLSSIVPKSDLNSTTYNRLKVSETEFCAEGNSNCTTSKLPAADVNGALLFVPANEGSKEQLARSMFRENVVGVPLQGLKTSNQVNSPMGQKTYFESNRLAALVSPAAYSLAYIDAANTRSINRDGKMYSANELIDQTVSRYYGGSEAKDWQASMIAQEPRGLLVETARLNGLSLWMDNHMYQQSLRKEANLAAILISTSEPLSADVKAIGNKNNAYQIKRTASVFK